MPSLKQTISGVAISAVILAGGGYLASEMAPMSDYIVSYDTTPVQQTVATDTVTPATSVASGNLQVTIQGIERAYGTVVVMIYGDENSYNNYDASNLYGYVELPVSGASVTAEFTDLGDGPFAVSFYHDEDENGTLTYMEEYPIEGYGGSGMTTPYDEPSFGDASVHSGAHVFTMQYIK